MTNFPPPQTLQDVNDRLGEPYERFGRFNDVEGVSHSEDLRKGLLVGSMEVDEKMNR